LLAPRIWPTKREGGALMAAKRVAVSGYFDPIHVGHLEYFELAKQLGDKLVVIVNNNHQCVLKKGKPFMDEADRMRIVNAMGIVDEVFLAIDDDKSVCKSLEALRPDVFANGGDRHVGEIPESAICRKHGIELADGLGAKVRSSSDLTGLKEKK
jgi:cytidyltransferase-like protein